jgi:hypothetical protein
MALGDGNVERLRLGVALDLPLLTVQACLGPGCHVPIKATTNITR